MKQKQPHIPYFMIKSFNGLRCYYNPNPKPLAEYHYTSFKEGKDSFDKLVRDWEANTKEVKFANDDEENKIYYFVREKYGNDLPQFVDDKVDGIQIYCATLDEFNRVIFKEDRFTPEKIESKVPSEQNNPSAYEDCLDSQEFYNLMQAYRHSNISEQSNVSKSYASIKEYLRNNFRRLN